MLAGGEHCVSALVWAARAAHHALQALLIDAVHDVKGADHQRAVQEALQGGPASGQGRVGSWRAGPLGRMCRPTPRVRGPHAADKAGGRGRQAGARAADLVPEIAGLDDGPRGDVRDGARRAVDAHGPVRVVAALGVQHAQPLAVAVAALGVPGHRVAAAVDGEAQHVQACARALSHRCLA